jgi:regulator of nucleoside diphosphate kinase
MRPFTHDIVLTEFDRRRLAGMLQVLRKRSGIDAWNLDALEVELGRARIVPPERVPPTVVTMNSRVRICDLDSGALFVVSLVFPDEHAATDSGVAVLSPLGLALLGCQAGDVMAWRTQDGLRRLRVDAVIYQPEAEGNFYM